MTTWTAPNWTAMANLPREWVRTGQDRSLCQVGHLTGYLSWGGEVLTYGIMGVDTKQWDLKGPVSGAARVEGVEAWARKQVEAMIAETIAQYAAA